MELPNPFLALFNFLFELLGLFPLLFDAFVELLLLLLKQLFAAYFIGGIHIDLLPQVLYSLAAVFHEAGLLLLLGSH